MKLKIIGIVVAAVAVVGGLSAGWFFYFKEPDPQTVLKNMVIAMESARSMHYAGALEISLDTSNLEPFKKFVAEAGALFFSPDEKKIESNLLMSGDLVLSEDEGVTAHQGKLDFYISGSKSPNPIFTVSAETRSVDKITYAQLTAMKFPVPVDLSVLLNKWMKFDGQKILGELDLQKEAITGEKQEERGVTAEQRKKLRELAREMDVYNVVEVLPSERIDRVSTYHYRVKLKAPEAIKFIEKSREIMGGPEPTEEDKKVIDKLIEKLPDLTAEVWIGKRNFMLYREKFTWPVTIDDTRTEFDVSGPKKVTDHIPLEFAGTLNLSNFNVPVTVTAPEGARDFAAVLQEAMQQILPGLLGGLPAGGDAIAPPAAGGNPFFNPKIKAEGFTDESFSDTDNDGLNAAAETFWGTDSKKADTDGDGVSDGDEINAGTNPAGTGNLY